MKKIINMVLSVAMVASVIAIPLYADAANTEEITYNYSLEGGSYSSSSAHTRRMETLDRGLIAVKTDSGVYLSWRLFDSEDNLYGSAGDNVSFKVYRDNKEIATVTDTTNYTDTTVGTSYSVAPVVNGQEGEKCEAITVNNNSYFDIPLEKPADETVEYVYPYTDSEGNVSTQATYSFFPADCSTGDLDGDGEYEIIVKWTSSERDVGSPGDPAYSGTVRFAAYNLDGTKLWDNDITLGKNVYSSAHTAQFLVYDFDSDGKSEMMVQTSLGSKDANGNYVSHAAKSDAVVASTGNKIADFTDEQNDTADYRNYGRITAGEEFLTVFNGETGAAVDTIDLPTSRGNTNGVDYGDDFGNRSNRFIASVAYLDGVKPYAVYMRGYYFGRNGRQRTSIAGISFDGEKLSPDYRFDTQKNQPGYYEGAYQYVGQGNHNCTVADVDNDGKDEFITGALCMEVKDDGSFKPRWCTYLQHGDALHIGDYDPTHKGLEFFTVHEDEGTNTLSGTDVTMDFGMSVIDADTGDIIFHMPNTKDTGRGVMANIGSGGYYQITGVGSYQCNGGTNFTATRYGAGSNFRIFWDGDLYDELLDGTAVTSWNGRNMSTIFNAGNYNCKQINGTKANPSLQADLFGDWREELVYPTSDGTKLRVFTTTTPTNYKIKTLMHDPVYRSGVAAEQTAYNQPPHVGFYMGEDMFDLPVTGIEITSLPNKLSYTCGESLNTDGMVITATYSDGTKKDVTAYSISDFDSSASGEQTITVSYQGHQATFSVKVKELSRIAITHLPNSTTVYQNSTLDTTGMLITAYYSDGTSELIEDYNISYDSTILGTQTATVTYMDKTASFKITVAPTSILALNNTYTTDSKSESSIPIGNYTGNFTLEHTVKINSMPANGSADKNINDGFFMRFMGIDSNNLLHTGGGWYLTQSGDKAQVVWKNSRTSNIGNIDIGKEYTFKYEFKNVGSGSGASVDLTITDKNGTQVASQSGLNIRNFSDTNTGKLAPITYVQIFNQSKSGSSNASVKIDNAKIYTTASIMSVNGADITINTSSLSLIKLFAAKYDDNNMLTDIEVLTPLSTGESTVQASFVPDKVFLWSNDLTPIDFWNGK